MCGDLGCVVVGGGVPTNNEPIKVAPSKEFVESLFLPCRNGGAGRGLIPPTRGGRPCLSKECR